ncbi:MAG: thiamine pyrophosphate-dependent enzyme [Methanosarcinaceae archaeon]|nr:thiamine pyrophosphate-dependent enzyme [Methanosarcinaceae archaeon]
MTPTTTSTTGLEALYLAAVDSNVSFVTAVAGYPITAVMDRFLENNKDAVMGAVVGADVDTNATIDAKWMTNEKVALEGALGASVSGRRALVLTKHVGMNVLSDPLVTSVTHTIGAGLVIFAGDDPGVAASQNEQDSRWYGEIAEVAVYDPSTPQDAYSAVVRAFELSEQVSAPVIVRITHRLEISEGLLDRVKKVNKDQYDTKVVFDRSIWAITMRGKHEKLHLESYPKLVEEAENTLLNKLTMGSESEDGNEGEYDNKGGGKWNVGIISSGYPSALVANVLDTRTNVSHLELGMVNPIPFNTVREFVKTHKRILIVEETEPFIESHLCILDNVLGKKTGHLPYGQVDVEHIEYALDHINNDTVVKYTDIQTIASRGARSICDDCPYLPLYHILHDLDVLVAGDLGCSVRSAPAPLEAVDTGFALGSSIAVACGFEKKGIAVIGDFGLAHSGIVGLINAVHCGFDVVVIVLQNKIAAMTGGQDVPDLTDVVKAEVADVTSFDIDEGVIGTLFELINEKLGKRGVSVIFVKGKCRKY